MYTCSGSVLWSIMQLHNVPTQELVEGGGPSAGLARLMLGAEAAAETAKAASGSAAPRNELCWRATR